MRANRIKLPSRLPPAIVLALLSGCAGSTALEFPDRAATPIDPVTTGSVSGEVRLEGTPPPREDLGIGSVAGCAGHASPPLSESVIVTGGKVQNVVVHVKRGLEGRVFTIPREPVTIDQKGCVFVPHVVAVQTYEPVRFTNGDPLLHNVRAATERNKSFNVALSAQGSDRTTQFKTAEFVPIRCDVHAWMSAYVAVVDNPFHAVTGADGAFTLTGLPAGTYVLEAWHETLGTAAQEVTIAAGGKAAASFVLTAR